MAAVVLAAGVSVFIARAVYNKQHLVAYGYMRIVTRRLIQGRPLRGPLPDGTLSENRETDDEEDDESDESAPAGGPEDEEEDFPVNVAPPSSPTSDVVVSPHKKAVTET